MTIFIFAGTKNGRELVDKLALYDCKILVSSMSDHGDKLITKGEKVSTFYGKKSMEEISQIIINHHVDRVIDSTHPYAKEISSNLIKACEKTQTKLIRYERPSSIEKSVGIHFQSMAQVCEHLSLNEGNVLFTTGINEIPEVVKHLDEERIYVRIIPIKSSIDKAISCKLNMNQVIQKNPPFDYQENVKHIRDHKIKYLVTKDSGLEGMTEAKIKAALANDVEVLVIDRPDIKYEHVFFSQEALLEDLKL